ncbi:MAG: glycosyltransferase family 4 protein [Methylococcaceae bacterium]|jgi:glycosyltransferase involved in cell wall biosynthesis
MMIVSHPTGNQNLRNAVEAFHKANQLIGFYTTVAWNSQSALAKLMPQELGTTLKRRDYSNIPAQLIFTHPLIEACRLLAGKLKLNTLTEHETGIFSVDGVYREFDNFVAKQLHQHPSIKRLYAYEDCSLASFQAAKRLNIQTLYELPIGYWRAAQIIMREEAELNPAWADTLLSMRDSQEKLARKDQELALADKIIVASQFTAETLKLSEVGDKEIIVIPYGSPPPVTQPNLNHHKKLKVLFVGGLSQRKGLSYLLEAAKILKDKIELTIIGSRIGKCIPLDNALQEYRYIPSLPHHKILEEMDNHDVFVFPSLFEGFGLVILEAMARGIPVITTSHTAGPDIITDGQDGFIVPIRSHQAIAEKLELLANDRDLLNQLKIAALAKASFFSWKSYQDQLVLQLNT